MSDGRLSYQFLSNGYIRRSVYAYSGRHRAGYLYAWLSSEWTLPLIRRHTYGAVIFEIDQHHLADVEVPLLEEPLMSEINHLVLEANRLRYLALQNEQLASAIFKREIVA